MKSPFPGMDPYLEDQGRWPDFHARAVTYCCDLLGQRLPGDYVAQMGEDVRVVTWQENDSRSMQPNVFIVRDPGFDRSESGGIATMPTLEPIAVPFATAEDEVRDTWIEIRRLPGERLVTAIEILSPTNKGSRGLSDYYNKRTRLWSEPVNMVEIDLLIAGRRLPIAKPLPPADYYTIVSRGSRSETGDVYAWSIRQPLPRISIPLEEPDPDVSLDLGELFNLAYERGRYERLIHYEKSLELPLHPEERTWAEGVARAVAPR